MLFNISKKTEWSCDEHRVYKLTKRERGNLINVWYPKTKIIFKGKPHTINEYWTLKECDEETRLHLYHRKYNPISLKIMPSRQKPGLFDLCARIHSVDDSSYGIWWIGHPEDILVSNRLEIMKYVSGLNKPINGEEFLVKCLNLGADKEQIDYN